MSPLSEPESFTILFYDSPLNSTRGCIQMAVTAAVVTKNVRMSRCWKAELVVYGIYKQPFPCFTHLLPQNLIVRRSAQSVQKVFSTLSRFQNPVAIEVCIRIDRMTNQREAEFVNGNFGI
jgi:hypothetical protein